MLHAQKEEFDIQSNNANNKDYPVRVNFTFGMGWLAMSKKVNNSLIYCALFAGEKTQYIFNITKKGTYMFYGKVERNERRDCTDNIDLVRLQWRRPNASEITKITRFYNNNEKYVAEIMAFDVLLEENSEVQLQLNCKGNNNTGMFTYRVY